MAVTRAAIAAIEPLIRPHVRRTPVVEEGNLIFKLELLQHSGSFKERGAFANLLTRAVPAAGRCRVGRQSWRGGRLRGAEARNKGADLRPGNIRKNEN